jgi:two-component system, OmpR family, alkaline phosphatase synthesis response regulator PhoP
MERKEPLATSSLKKTEQERIQDSSKYHKSGANKEFLILVVDDSIDNVVVISLDLQVEGYKVVTASNGKEAVSVARLTTPDLILMDISMPLLDGLAAARKIHEIQALQDVPVIAITAFSTEGFQRAAYDVGVAGYLVKPIDFNRMRQLVRRLLAPRDLDHKGSP